MVNTQSEHIVSSESSIDSFIRFETKSQQQVAQAVFKPGILLHQLPRRLYFHMATAI